MQTEIYLIYIRVHYRFIGDNKISFSSKISDYTINNFYSLERFGRHQRPSSGTELSLRNFT